MLHFLDGLTHDEETSLDMVQEMFFSLWENRQKLKQIRSFNSYLFQMARFTVYDYFDHLTVSQKYMNEYFSQTSETISEEEALFVRELQQIIRDTVKTLSPQQAKIYRMSRDEGLSNVEIATRLGISKRTVENHLTAALSVLRKVLLCLFVSIF